MPSSQSKPMPTVPPACVPLDPLTSIPLPESDFLSGDGSVGRPTPDPDDDNLMLVQSDSGAIPQVGCNSAKTPHKRALILFLVGCTFPMSPTGHRKTSQRGPQFTHSPLALIHHWNAIRPFPAL